MNMTQQQLEEGFKHQVKMFSSLGREKQAELWAQAWAERDRELAQSAAAVADQILHGSQRKTARRKQATPSMRAGAVVVY